MVESGSGKSNKGNKSEEANQVDISNVLRVIDMVINELGRTKARINSLAVMLSDLSDGIDSITNGLLLIRREVMNIGERR